MRASRLITVVDAHAEGETGKVVTGGVPDVPGRTMLEKALHLERHGDWLRRFLLTEPNVPTPKLMAHRIAFPVLWVGSAAPAMPGHRQAAVTPSRGREKRPSGRP